MDPGTVSPIPTPVEPGLGTIPTMLKSHGIDYIDFIHHSDRSTTVREVGFCGTTAPDMKSWSSRLAGLLESLETGLFRELKQYVPDGTGDYVLSVVATDSRVDQCSYAPYPNPHRETTSILYDPQAAAAVTAAAREAVRSAYSHVEDLLKNTHDGVD